MILERFFNNNKAVSQQSNHPTPPEHAETTKNSPAKTNNDNKLSFRLSDKHLYEAITNWCRINNVSVSKFITDAVKAHAQTLQLNVGVDVRQSQTPRPRQTALKVTVPVWLTKNADPPPPPAPKADDPAAALMKQWRPEQAVRENEIQEEFSKERRQSGYKGDWIEQPPNRGRK
jgi:hypothetical protein